MTSLEQPQAAITGWSVYVPDIPDLPPAPGPAQARALLGRKGLLYKDDATKLALCAVHRALGLADGVAFDEVEVDHETAVVASSNLGNLDSVVGVVRLVRAEGWREVSVMTAPNASSNVIASTVAIWFRCGGPNLMMCSGATSGLDALRVGSLLLAAGRARRVLVVGVEPADEVAVAWNARRPAASKDLIAGAGCVILEPVDRCAPGQPMLGRVQTVDAPPRPDLAPQLPGDLYGGEGIVRVAMAAAELTGPDGPASVQVCCGDSDDGWRSVLLHRAVPP